MLSKREFVMMWADKNCEVIMEPYHSYRITGCNLYCFSIKTCDYNFWITKKEVDRDYIVYETMIEWIQQKIGN